jgi:SAM-dependent methyltransferase
MYDDRSIVNSITRRSLDPDGPKALLFNNVFSNLLLAHERQTLDPRILDVGAGVGWLSYLAKKALNIAVDSYDPSPEMRVAAQMLADKTGFAVLDGLSLDVPSIYSLVLANWVISAISKKDDLEYLFSRIMKLTRSGGELVVINNHPEFLGRQHKYFRVSMPPGGCLAPGNSHETMLLDSSGTEVVAVKDFFWPTHLVVECAKASGFKLKNAVNLWDTPRTPEESILHEDPAYQMLIFFKERTE